MIRILSKDVVNKIAAGEVVERPASVLKELLENSIDAGSKNIEVFIKNGGIDLIQVSDDGHGISSEDFDKLFIKHSTSKIIASDDLEKISSFGFRGEALSSIGAVADVIIETKHDSDEIGTELIFLESTMISQKPGVRESGTSIQVQNIFEKIPARRKFLKSKVSETKALIDVFNRFVLAYPSINFLLNVDGKLKRFPAQLLITRITQILKVNTKDLIEVNYQGKINVSGSLMHPRLNQKNKSLQYLYVNGRFVNDALVSKAIYDGYSTFLMKGNYPGFVIFLELDPAEVDVNVHPRKTEVRFANTQQIYLELRRLVDHILKVHSQEEIKAKFTKLENSFLNKTNSQKDPQVSDFEHFLAETSQEENVIKVEDGRNPEQTNVLKALDFSKEILQEKKFEYKVTPEHEFHFDTLNIIQLLNSYIITSNNDTLLVIDQHAASERYHYEKYLKSIKKMKVHSKVLLFPEIITFDSHEIDLILEKHSVFEKLGFELDRFGDSEVRVTSVPEFVKMENFPRILKIIIEDILENQENINSDEEIISKIAASMACHTAVRFGDNLTREEMLKIVNNLALCEDPYNCPHGRPIIQEYTQYDLEKKFKRCGF